MRSQEKKEKEEGNEERKKERRGVNVRYRTSQSKAPPTFH